MTNPYRVLVTGSRDWPHPQTVEDALNHTFHNRPRSPLVVVHGACRTGADQHASQWAQAAMTTGPVVEEQHPAAWTTGRRAGPERNARMVALGADLCLAFLTPASRGGAHCASLAEQAGIETRRFTA